MQVVVDSLLTTYRLVGGSKDATAPGPLVILHGWGDSSQGWLSFSKRLKSEVYLVDLPGFGATDAPPVAWGLDEYAAFVAHFLAKVDVKPYALIGHSNGGAIAVRGMATGLLEAERLVLLASAGIRGEYKGRTKALRMVAKAGKMLTSPLPESLTDRLRRKLYTTVGSDMFVAEHLQATFKKVVADDVRADAARISEPTLLVYGQQDISTPPNYGRMFHELLPDSTLEIIEAGHFVHLDQPRRVAGLVREFLA